MPRVFRCHQVNAFQHFKSPQGDVAQIANGRGHHVKHCIFSVKACLTPRINDAPMSSGHQPKIFAKTKGATIVASDSITNRGVSTFSFPHVIFSFGTAPEYEPKLVVESLIWQKYPHSGTGMLTTS